MAKNVIISTLVSLLTVALAHGRLPDPAGCIASSCDNIVKINTLFCHELAEYFCQCVPVEEFVWTEMVRPCALGTVFSFPHQKCVYEDMRDPDACYPLEASGSGDDLLIPCDDDPLCRAEKEKWISDETADEMAEDVKQSVLLLEGDAMEFLFPRRVALDE